MGKFDSQPGQEPKFEVIHNIAENPLEDSQDAFEKEGKLELAVRIPFEKIKTPADAQKERSKYANLALEDDDDFGMLAMVPKEREKALEKIANDPDFILAFDRVKDFIKAGGNETKAMAELGAEIAKARDKKKADAIRKKITGK